MAIGRLVMLCRRGGAVWPSLSIGISTPHRHSKKYSPGHISTNLVPNHEDFVTRMNESFVAYERVGINSKMGHLLASTDTISFYDDTFNAHAQ